MGYKTTLLVGGFHFHLQFKLLAISRYSSMTANLISQFDANSITEQIEQPVRYREAFRNLLTLEMLKSYSA